MWLFFLICLAPHLHTIYLGPGGLLAVRGGPKLRADLQILRLPQTWPVVLPGTPSVVSSWERHESELVGMSVVEPVVWSQFLCALCSNVIVTNKKHPGGRELWRLGRHISQGSWQTLWQKQVVLHIFSITVGPGTRFCRQAVPLVSHRSWLWGRDFTHMPTAWGHCIQNARKTCACHNGVLLELCVLLGSCCDLILLCVVFSTICSLRVAVLVKID